jgi:hypothetical protein
MPTLSLHAAEPLTAVFGVMLYPADEDIAARDCWDGCTPTAENCKADRIPSRNDRGRSHEVQQLGSFRT